MTNPRQTHSDAGRGRPQPPSSCNDAQLRMAAEIGRLTGKLLADDEQQKNSKSGQSAIPKSTRKH